MLTLLAALFAAFQSWVNGREIAEIRGSLGTLNAMVVMHVHGPGLHAGR